MEANIEQLGEKAIITISGRLDSVNSSDFEKVVEPVSTCEIKFVEIDCKALEYICSSGLRIFLSMLKSVKPRGGNVTIKSLTPDLKQIFDICGFTPFFVFE